MSKRLKVRRILLVEDNEMNCDMLARRLQRNGYAVLTASDGAQGYAMACSEAPDLILMDIGLPDTDGWQLTRLLKTTENTQQIPIIALTAHALATDRQRAHEVGCDDYDTKPVDFARLTEKINNLLVKRECYEYQS
jgi:two-component system cell cycle response regulator DivK